MKRVLKVICVVFVLLINLVIFTSTASSKQSKVIELKMVSMRTPTGTNKEFIDAWGKFLSHESGGRIKITVYGNGTLLPVGQEFEAVKTGMADLATVDSIFLTGQINKNLAICLPGTVGWPGALQASLTHMELYQKYIAMQDEFKGLKLLYFVYGPPTQIQTTKKPIHTLEDFKGLNQIEIGQYAAESMKLLGGTPQNFPISESFDALMKGVADGISLGYDATALFYLDAINYTTEVNLVVPTVAFILMNMDAWNKLPSDIQKCFSQENCMKACKLWNYLRDKGDMAAKVTLSEKYKKKGLPEIYVLPDKEKVRWKAAIEPVKDKWKKAAGPIGKEIARDVEKIAPKYRWNRDLEKECSDLLYQWKSY